MSSVAARTLPQRRAEAQARWDARGLPTRRIEEWKYSDLKAALGEASLRESGSLGASIRHALAQGIEQYDLAEGDVPKWVKDNFGRIGSASVMSDASIAYSENLVALRVPAGLTADLPVEIELVGTGNARILIVVGEGASLTVLETPVVGGDTELFNAGLEIRLEANASFRHVRLGSHLPSAIVVETIAVAVAEGAVYRAHFANFGAKLSRVELEIVLEGEGAAAHLSGVSVLNGLHADVTTHVTHVAGNTQSTQLFKHVAGGDGRAVYQGKVTVAKGADGADSRQTAKALLLGERAEADLKPELEILADDVKCAHGAAVGDLDSDSLFYLQSRGIPEAEARRLLLHAFLEDAIAEVAEPHRAMVRDAVNAALEGVA